MMSAKIAITPSSGSIPTCKPNLMPFHIDYNGPAAVSTFMPVEKLVDTIESAETHGRELQTDNSSKESGNCPPTVSRSSRCLQATASLDMLSESTPLTRTTTESTLIAESSFTTLEGSTSDVTVSSSSSFPQMSTQSQDLAPPIEDVDQRYISTFRGRTIHGLTINLPDGYAGVVLKSTNDRMAEFDEKASGRTGRGDLQRTKHVDLDVEMEPQGQRRRGRLRSSAVPRKGTVITIPDDDNAPQSSNPSNLSGEHCGDVEMAVPLSTLDELDDPLRTLVPTARFDSFTLWQADRMVNHSNDEYWRTLSEWIGLAHEIHKV